ncbi:MAG: 1-(5-phosphoribosyl)-5-[(5-phosphoribosylamino)methylideneamino]imidazole-4-carboxamide isomerase [Pseudomonadota bacterium]|jgi:phosphoribosylformimino-5-aminoimidazole carboxamide ribotide isomerase
MSLLLIPAIDLKDGQCVRLRQGDLNDATVFSGNPGEQAAHWVAKGARRLHIVDLNGAVAGKPKNEAAIKAIIQSAGPEVPVQVGGGIRDLDTIERFLDDGASFVVIGTAAVKNPGLLKDACAAFPGQIIVSIDAKDGKVATDGWSKLSGHEVIDLAQKFEDDGVSAVLYTDIGRDGMMTGVNLEATVRLAQSVSIPIIASGGIAGLKDIQDLCAVESEGVMGAILGRALYEGKLDLDQAQATADGLDAPRKA